LTVLKISEMDWKTLGEIVVFLVSLAGVFFVGNLLRIFIEKLFHIHLS